VLHIEVGTGATRAAMIRLEHDAVERKSYL